MDRRDAIAWMLSACAAAVRYSQAKTLMVLVQAGLHCPRISLANLGRSMGGGIYVKHRIKRAWRFMANERLEPVLAMSAVVQRLLKNWPKAKFLLISFDWTDIRGIQTLVAAANVRGRAIPLAWASCQKHVYDGHRSRNAFEESLLWLLRGMIPPHVSVILLADRGFGRTELGRFCQLRGLHYVIRIQPKVQVSFSGQVCRLDQYPVRYGRSERLDNVLYRQHDPLAQHVVVRWKKGLPEHRDEPWYLMTDLNDQGFTARRLSDLYGRRMSIEQLFRDGKNKRQGWALRDTGLKDPARLDRLILVLALAYLLLIGVGLLALRRYRPSAWCSNTRPDSASLFLIGQFMLQAIGLGPPLLTALIRQLQAEVPNWG